MKTSSAMQKTYPKVKFWSKGLWTASQSKQTVVSQGTRGGARCAEGINVQCRYIEDENGEPVDGHRAKVIRDYAARIFAELLSKDMAPQTWGQATLDARQMYEQSMAKAFPEMRLCEAHWKAHHLATSIYPSWSQTHMHRRSKAKAEEENATLPPRKRFPNDARDESRKRVRADIATPSEPLDTVASNDDQDSHGEDQVSNLFCALSRCLRSFYSERSARVQKHCRQSR